MRTAWWRRALQQRLGTLAAAALVLWVAVTAIAASVATDRIADALLAERRVRARDIAGRVDAALESTFRQLDLVAMSAAASPDGTAGEVRRVRGADAVVRVAPGGEAIWTRAVRDGRRIASLVDRLPVPSTGRWTAETTPLQPTTHGPRLFIVIPARESDPLGGAVAAAIDPASATVRALVAPYAREPYAVSLVDDAGATIATSGSPAPTPRRDASDLVASAPITSGRWRVELVQPRQEALAPVLALRGILVGSSLILLPFAVLAALGTARSIRGPVLELTDAAERLAHGDVITPIPLEGEDEIGRLSLALERLRQALEGDDRRSRLLKRVIRAHEDERCRIARELHDETAQQLTVLGMQLDTAAATHADLRGALGPSRSLVRSINDGLHGIIHGLRPAMLDDLGLLPAIRSYAQTHLAAHGVHMHYEFADTTPPLSREATTALYRVAQEAITNVERHAHAGTVMIGCTAGDDTVVLEIEDDGVGFEPSGLTHPRETGEGLGLLGMRERLALLGGRLEVESEPGRGTRILAVLPTSSPDVRVPTSECPDGTRQAA